MSRGRGGGGVKGRGYWALPCPPFREKRREERRGEGVKGGRNITAYT